MKATHELTQQQTSESFLTLRCRKWWQAQIRTCNVFESITIKNVRKDQPWIKWWYCITVSFMCFALKDVAVIVETLLPNAVDYIGSDPEKSYFTPSKKMCNPSCHGSLAEKSKLSQGQYYQYYYSNQYYTPCGRTSTMIPQTLHQVASIGCRFKQKKERMALAVQTSY